MGASGELQYMMSLTIIAIFMKFIISNFDKKNYRKYAYLIIILYTVIKFFILKYFDFEENMIDTTIFVGVVLFIFLSIEFFILKHKQKSKEEILAEIKIGGYGFSIIQLVIPISMILFKVDIYNSSRKNFILLIIELSLSGILCLLLTRKGIKMLNMRNI